MNNSKPNNNALQHRSPRNILLKCADRVIDVFIFLIFALCFSGFLACVVVYNHSHREILKLWELVYLIPTALCMFLLFLTIHRSLKLSRSHFLILWILYFLVQSACLIAFFQSPPQGDGGGIYKEALYLFNGGEFVHNSSNYFYRCYWLMGTVYFEKLLMSIIGTSYTAFKILGAVLLLGSGLCLYRITEIHLGEKVAKIAFALYVLFAPITLNVSHFAHQHIAFFLLMLSLLLLSKPSFIRGIAAGALLGLMNIFRPWGILMLVSLACFGVYKLIAAGKTQKIHSFKMIGIGLVLLIVYFGAGRISNALLIQAGYLDPAVSSGSSMMLIKIDRGIDPESFGDEVAEKTRGLEGEEYNETLKACYVERIKQLLTSGSAYVYIANKMSRMFGSVDYWFENLFADKMAIYDVPSRFLYFFNWYQYILLLPIGFYGYMKYRKKHTFILLSVFTIGYVCAHLFIEAFSSYRICVYPLLIMLSAYGLKEWFENGRLWKRTVFQIDK